MTERKALNDWVRGDDDFIVLKIAVHHLLMEREHRQNNSIANVPVVLLSDKIPNHVEEGIDMFFVLVVKRG